MQLNNLPKTDGRSGKRLGRGLGSGRGKTAGRGTKGQKSRSGHNIPRRFEGGQMPLIQRLPKLRGFKSHYEVFQIVKISLVDKSFKPGELVSPKTLKEKGLIESTAPIKIIGDKKVATSFQFRNVKLTKKLLKENLSKKATATEAPKVTKKKSIKK
jgi:large subunit ribosomal protein L15